MKLREQQNPNSGEEENLRRVAVSGISPRCGVVVFLENSHEFGEGNLKWSADYVGAKRFEVGMEVDLVAETRGRYQMPGCTTNRRRCCNLYTCWIVRFPIRCLVVDLRRP